MKKSLTEFIIYNFKKIWKLPLIFRLFLLTAATVVLFSNSVILAQGAQGIVITGTVTDISTGEPLPGANIVVQGTYIGTVTDLNGAYSITVPNEQAVLVFSYVGYESQLQSVGSRRQISLGLKSEAAALEEVVVVGYGVQKKESVVGAVSQTSGETIRQNVQGGDLRSGLTGSVPGLITLRTTGRPGGADFGGSGDQPIVLLIRGQKTWNDAAPLVLVDGVERDLHNINPYEIEKISVLKDASATAVFGVKGANGVILITTQRGLEGKAKLTFDYGSTFKTLSRVAEKARAYDANLIKNWAILNEVSIRPASWLRIKPESWVNYYKTQEYPEYFPDMDWLDVTMKDYTVDQNMNLTMSGGTKFVKYFNSIAFLNETDLINQKNIGQGYDPSFNFKRLNVRSNLDFSITPTTTLSTNLSGIYYNQRRSRGGNYAFRGIWNAAPDTWPIKYRDGIYAEDMDVVNASNVLWEWNYSGYTLWKGTQINTDFILKQKLDFVTKGLSAQAKLSYDNLAKTAGSHVTGVLPMTKFIDPAIVDDPRFRSDLKDPELAALEAEYTTWNVSDVAADGYDWTPGENNFGTETVDLNVTRAVLYEFALNYNRDFGKHAFSGLALMNRHIIAKGSEFASYREDWVGRVTYAYDRKYLFEANAAYNGSEKFDRKYRFGFFPSVALGWIASNESFFIPIKPFMNNLKFRYSDGTVGSDAGIMRWQYAGSWIVHPDGGAAQTVFYFGYPSVQRSYPMRYEDVIANPDIHWEVARKRDIGVETGFFENKLKISFDYFIENRTDVFVTGTDRFIPNYFGATPVSANIGKVNVKGWELEAEFIKTTQKGFTFWLSHTWAFARDKIIYAGDPELRPDYQKKEGYPINQRRVTLQQGNQLFQTWNDIYITTGGETGNESLLPGDPLRVDFNSDGIINSNDVVPYGFPSRPQYSYAPSAGISYKNLSANLRFYGVYNIQGGVGMRELTSMYTEGEATVAVYSMNNSWSPEMGNTINAVMPALRFQSASPAGTGDAYSVTALNMSRSYFRLESAEIAYSLNSKNSALIKRLGLSNIRFSLSGNNLFLMSEMLTDIEYAGESTTETRTNYPVLKRYNLGVSIDF